MNVMLQHPTSILVTGASGFIGSAVTRRLVDEGCQVRCLIRSTSRTDRLDALPVERALGDIRDADAVRLAADGCHAIIHLAGISAWSEIASPLVEPVIVKGTENILEAARISGVSRVLYVSSAASLGPVRHSAARDETAEFDEQSAEGMAYVGAKREAECLCQKAVAAGLDVVVVNPAEVYGPEDHDLVTAGNLVTLLRSFPVLVCRGGTSIVHVDDVVEGIVRALHQGRRGERYLLGGDNLTHRELAELLLTIAGRRSRVFQVPVPLLGFLSGLAHRLGIAFPIPRELLPYVTHYWFLDCQKSRRDLGMQFRSARETLTPTVSWLRASGFLK